MYVEKSKSKSSVCRICNNYIEDEYRIFVYEKLGKHYYHIGCIIKAGEVLKLQSYKKIIDARPDYDKGVNVTEL